MTCTRRGTILPINVTSGVLEHAAGNDNAPKCNLSRAGGGTVGDDNAHYCTQTMTSGHGLRTLFPWIVLKWRLGSRQRLRAPSAGRDLRVPAVQHEGGIPIGRNQGRVAG